MQYEINEKRAFPHHDRDRGYGMSLRDYFAAHALASGYLKDTAEEWELRAWFGNSCGGVTKAEILAARAYNVADAMLVRRKVMREKT